MKSVASWKQQAKTLIAGGQRFAYWTQNEADESKPWLVLLHGYPTSSWDWTYLWRDLAAHFRLAALDMLGFGFSDKPREVVYSIFTQADFQEAFLEHLGVGEAHILAHDYGDTVAQELLARHNEGSLSFLIRSVVFLNGGLFPEQHRALIIQKIGLTPFGFLLGRFMTRGRLKKALSGIFGPATRPSEQEIEAHWTILTSGGGLRVLHKLLRYIPERRSNRERWVGALLKSTVPLRLIDGGADPVSGVHLFHRYKEVVPNADAVLLETIGHYPQIEAPETVARAFLDFHQQLRTSAA